MTLEQAIQEAKRLLNENPNLKYYEAIAKEKYKKDPQDCNPKGAIKNNI